MKLSATLLCLFLVNVTLTLGFMAAPAATTTNPSLTTRIPSHNILSSSSEALSESTTANDNPMNLTPELLKIANAFEMIGDDKLRYKQLLFMANQAPPMDPTSQTPANQVPGCLSTVFVDGTAEKVGDDVVITFTGDSDGLLTKGLVSLLVRGLSGNTARAIQQVDPRFVQQAGISTSLTPGRNNGFLNMLQTMKNKALELEASCGVDSVDTTSEASAVDTDDNQGEEGGGVGPMYRAIRTELLKLQPTVLELRDVSYQHAGHVEGGGEESHFELEIVAEAFDGLNLVKRHKLVYMLLGDVMPKIHALQISAKTPSEVA